MKKKAISLFLLILLIFMCIPHTAHAVPNETNPIPSGPNVKNLQGTQEINNIFQTIKRLRANFITININSSVTNEELESTSKTLDVYLETLNIIRLNLKNYKDVYQSSFPDLILAEQLSFISSSYSLSLIHQQYLIESLKTNKKDASQLFYSNYLLGVYYYLSLADQMLTYVDTYYTF